MTAHGPSEKHQIGCLWKSYPCRWTQSSTRQSAEILHADGSTVSPVRTAAHPASGWSLTPRSVLTFVLGDEPKGSHPSLSAACFPGALHRRLGDQPRPDAGRRARHSQELLSELMAAAICGIDPDHPGERGHHRGPDQVFVELRAAGPRAERNPLVPAPLLPRDDGGLIVRFEEITRCPLEIQDTLLSSSRTRPWASPSWAGRAGRFARAGVQRDRHGEHPRSRRERDERGPQAAVQLRDRSSDRRTSEEMALVSASRSGCWPVDVPVSLRPEITELLVTTFHELRAARRPKEMPRAR